MCSTGRLGALCGCRSSFGFGGGFASVSFYCESLFGLSSEVAGWRWAVGLDLGTMGFAALFSAGLLWKARGDCGRGLVEV